MKKLYTMFSALALGVLMQASAQVDVTFKVDVTDYLATKGEPLGANGVRIGGNFADQGATLTDGTAMVNWSPSDAASALTQEGATNIWSITVRFPADKIGVTQQYKFVDNDWGTNEGKDGSNIATEGCGTDDGSGNINRTLTIPAEAVTLTFCWDQCTETCGAASVNKVNTEVGMNIFPNPAAEVSTVEYTLSKSSDVTIEIYNSLGQLVQLNQLGRQSPGVTRYALPVAGLSKGIYFVKLTAGSAINTQRLNLTK
jgi:hypothetical protein